MLVRNPFVLPEIMPVDAIASSHSIYATTPLILDLRNSAGWRRCCTSGLRQPCQISFLMLAT
ncbi:MAG: hypothetical protein VB140_06705 [Burkholderia sp.]